ncbi:MAG TPA: FtsX-like permease family protein [Longimicrobiaceae bacterium]|nr:FtsX-like permease family protein [Longimicrobiaceae bacterium]
MSAFPKLAALAWRESRFARRRLFLFLSSISLGVAALVATQSFAASLAAGVRDQARVLLGADAALSSNRRFGPRAEALLDSLRRAGTPTARVTSFASMALAPRTGGTRLAQVRAVEGPFPFYGEIETEPAGRWRELARGRNVLVDPALLVALGARVGDSVKLGEAHFRLLGTLRKVPGEAGISTSFAPRAYIPARHLPETGLLRFGSRVEYEAFLRLPAPGAAERLAGGYRERLRAERVGIRTAQRQQERLSDALGRLGRYLGLIGTFALLLGGIGVASAMAAYMAEKRESIATLRCLGATAPQVVTIYLLQAGVMGIAGAALGAAAGVAVQWVLPRLMRGLLPVEVEVGVDPASVLTGVGVGAWVAVAFALLPLLATRRVSPLETLRRRVVMEPEPAPRDPWTWGARLLLAGSVVLLVVLQAGELRLGLGFAGGIAATLAGLGAAAWGTVRGVRRLRAGGLPYPLRQGVANLYRPGNQTRTVVLALGFGVFLLAVLYLMQDNLLRPLRPGAEGARANLVFFDVQEDQEAGVRATLDAGGVRVLQRAPIVPMRVAAINGRSVARMPRPEEQRPEGEDAGPRDGDEGPGGAEGWAVRREYRSTYRDTLVRSEKLLEGRWWGAGERRPAGAPAPVSLERGIAEDLGVKVGDRITWDVQGVQIPTRVASLREVDWARFEPNFFAVFPSDALAGAPQTWVLLAEAATAAERAGIQRDVVRRYPNVAALDLTEVQAALDDVLGRVSLVIRFLAGFSIATGFVVLLGAVSVSRLQRIRESVLLRTLGATRGQIGSILLVEYALLGLLAAGVGCGLAVAAGWALSRWVFELNDYAVPLLSLLGLGAAIALLAMGVGWWGSRETFRRTPLEALRGD